jgi:hypothetical protein
MSELEYKTVPVAGEALSATGVRENFTDIADALGDVSEENLETGSVFTRHIASNTVSGPGVTALPWKEQLNITKAVTGVNGNPGKPMALLIPDPVQSIACQIGRPVFVMAKIPVGINSWDAGTGSYAYANTGQHDVWLYADTGGGGAFTLLDTKSIKIDTVSPAAGLPAGTAISSETQTYIQMFYIFEATQIEHIVKVHVGSSANFNFNGQATLTVIATRS